MSNGDKDLKDKIHQLVEKAVQIDKELREKYHIADKFRFIREKLETLRVHVEQEVKTLQQEIEDKIDHLAEDEMLVYVYLYNAHGLVFHSWQKMVNASVFYEYSVNRPIYTDKNSVEAFIRSRKNQVQHGFLSVAIKKTDVLVVPADLPQPQDQLGNPLIKIREGSLLFNKMFSFMHQGNEYDVNSMGHLVKK